MEKDILSLSCGGVPWHRCFGTMEAGIGRGEDQSRLTPRRLNLTES